MSNTAIWNKVCTTDPAYTKEFRRSGGFRGTAVNFTYLSRMATDLFGPAGIGWGVDVLEEKYAVGAPINKPDEPPVNEVTHVIRCAFWYKHGEQLGRIISYGQTTYVGRDKNGYFTDEEAPKKSLTDAASKALSWLGFAADIHLGLYDDSKYVNSLKAGPAQEKEAPAPAPAGALTGEELLKRLSDSDSIDKLAKAWDLATPAQRKAYRNEKDAAKARLMEKK